MENDASKTRKWINFVLGEVDSKVVLKPPLGIEHLRLSENFYLTIYSRKSDSDG